MLPPSLCLDLRNPARTCLRSKVSVDTVSISYALFWEEREYWRLFTASFAHFEPLHLLFNAMGTWNTRELERLLGSFRYLYLVSYFCSSVNYS